METPLSQSPATPHQHHPPFPLTPAYHSTPPPQSPLPHAPFNTFLSGLIPPHDHLLSPQDFLTTHVATAPPRTPISSQHFKDLTKTLARVFLSATYSQHQCTYPPTTTSPPQTSTSPDRLLPSPPTPATHVTFQTTFWNALLTSPLVPPLPLSLQPTPQTNPSQYPSPVPLRTPRGLSTLLQTLVPSSPKKTCQHKSLTWTSLPPPPASPPPNSIIWLPSSSTTRIVSLPPPRISDSLASPQHGSPWTLQTPS
ncbi:hypothetical protein M427DRAFT_73675 [Gonapodya prolifera JEL478]|uniref:Uncharacterized protein n=1 Tax=Gonapodya prolifera (strain JEL478) TaxID=1344416 RepID=A0A139A1T7_GONPJ|nr:hypothetical protein M427DRAFT_73675 [Gonapodya prolifera JEL478]|eukprot:KXS10746.1 hypothetical protein M427DRAFT_73675 [Gonapodya prolifera JEL478]